MVAWCARILVYERILPSIDVPSQELKMPQGHPEMAAAKPMSMVRQEPTPAVHMASVSTAKLVQMAEAAVTRVPASTVQQEHMVAAAQEQVPTVKTAAVPH